MSAPVLDIVMLVHDCANWADLSIRAVEHHTKNAYRLIIVDMASQEAKTKAMLDDAEKRGHTVLRLSDNRSFSHGVNAGVEAGSAPFIVILNDDAIVHEGWDTTMLTEAAPKHVGMVGARTNFALGAQGMGQFFGDPPFLVFVCVALRRAVWNTIGPMDAENFDGFSGEDLDYSWRVLKAGYQLKLSGAYVYHAGSRTLANTLGDVERRRKNDEKYGLILRNKWGEAWIKEHSKLQPRILVITYHAEEHTRVAFMASLQTLKNTGGVGYAFHNVTRTPIHMARQSACDYAADNGYDVLVQFDDDATFPPDVIPRLLAHGKDAVTALAYQRKVPYGACIFELGPDGMFGRPLEGWEHTGLRKVDVSGFHCSAIKTSIIHRMRAAGIKNYFGGFENKVGEDFAFCLNMKKLGIPLYCDTGLISGHIGSAIVVDEQFKKNYEATKPR